MDVDLEHACISRRLYFKSPILGHFGLLSYLQSFSVG